MDSSYNFLDPMWVETQPHVPSSFIWPKEYMVEAQGELEAPLVDLDGFIRGDEDATRRAAKLITQACLSHGFFQVINHGIDSCLINEAYQQLDAFFKLPLHRKLSLPKTLGSVWGYSGAHAHRFSSKLPWKETLSFPFHPNNALEPVVSNFFNSNIGQDFQHAGMVFQKYCEGMKELGLKLMELLGISLGVDRLHYREFFEDGRCIMRCNYYPCCQEPSLVLGTGPHCDPTSLTILHQDEVGGLDVFTDNKWRRVTPRPQALVVNIGDTFSTLATVSLLLASILGREGAVFCILFVAAPLSFFPFPDFSCSVAGEGRGVKKARLGSNLLLQLFCAFCSYSVQLWSSRKESGTLGFQSHYFSLLHSSLGA